MPAGSARTDAGRVLTINSGSSSLKFAVIVGEGPGDRLWSGVIERIGQPAGRLRATNRSGETVVRDVRARTHEEAARVLLDFLGEQDALNDVSAIGHRVVHGGSRYVESTIIDQEVIAGLKEIVSFAPNHLPGEIAAIEALITLGLGVPQVACFDTAFHRTIPGRSRQLPIPRRYHEMGIQRYGFHGLSYQYLLAELARQAGAEAAQGRVIFAHLGAGSSLAAVRNGVCLETTMGFTPTAGVMMATRTGDLDPGVIVFLLRSEGLTADQLEVLLNQQSGLLGVSGLSGDVRDLLAAEGMDERAATALGMYCESVSRAVGSLAVVLEGIETLVFSAGIGENSAELRSRICGRLSWLGMRVDEDRNGRHAAVISRDDSPVTVRVIPTNEESMIFQEVRRMTSAREP